MAEMFLQSPADEISLLPALPKVYAEGTVKGLRARGDVIDDIAWVDGKLTTASLQSWRDQTVKLRMQGEKSLRTIKRKAGEKVPISPR